MGRATHAHVWYAGRPLPLFSVRLDAANGGGAVPDGIRLCAPRSSTGAALLRRPRPTA